ncbi:class I SAM-dependent methyltransferase [Humibacter ginsenosidimutans]|uniref:Class I SAM-dependent methyltransferase n=1 Tax=Humibacter ginsenosidimutans TaxID=2599293 RepID=A0A5B8M3C6_9MICO|nr:class I SAM-dependent methyltransferase [Humibacter ginsenosidimutans]QDZ14786.1 class I SAM-dependent methyltransferase [Humibacter ginsenosidimutans]
MAGGTDERATKRPVGTITRGTTNTNRLRRVDRWIAVQPVLRRASDPLVVDLGYGASGVTAFELERRLRRVRRDVRVLGLEIDPERVARASAQLEQVRAGETPFAPDARVSFARGGFEVPIAGGEKAAVIRAFNVLRQYDEGEVADAWSRMCSRLQVGGMLVEGTCDEIGRVASWVALTAERASDGSAAVPVSFTISLRLAGLEHPSIVAERLPKALIHRNVPGERVHAFLADLERSWAHAAQLAAYGPVQRWIAVVESMRDSGWPVRDGRSRWRLGELSVPWNCVAPA